MAKTRKAGEVHQLKITLRDLKPPVWRRVQVKDCSLSRLSDVIQTCMGWEGYHLHAFEIGGEQYSEPDPDGMMESEDERKFKLGQFIRLGFEKFSYTYDFGDNWRHTIQVEKTLPAEAGGRLPPLRRRQAGLPAGGLRRAVGLPGTSGGGPEPETQAARRAAGVGRRRVRSRGVRPGGCERGVAGSGVKCHQRQHNKSFSALRQSGSSSGSCP